MHKTLIAAAITATLALSACSTTSTQNSSAPMVQTQNPFLQASQLQYETPDFSNINDEHFQPALELGIKDHYQEVLAIANNSDAATFENTIIALEKSGELLTRTSKVFYNLAGTDSNPTLRKVQGEMAPKMAAHSDNINLNPALFARIETLYNQRESLELSAEENRLVEVYYKRFVRAGAKLTE
ncbi:dipeptidyl carboxypeptidase II, partial [Shewanella sp. 0m-11]